LPLVESQADQSLARLRAASADVDAYAEQLEVAWRRGDRREAEYLSGCRNAADQRLHDAQEAAARQLAGEGRDDGLAFGPGPGLFWARFDAECDLENETYEELSGAGEACGWLKDTDVYRGLLGRRRDGVWFVRRSDSDDGGAGHDATSEAAGMAWRAGRMHEALRDCPYWAGDSEDDLVDARRDPAW